MSAFAALGLEEPLTRAVAELGFTEPTPVQLACIPTILQGGDVWASAHTGSGKTAAYLLPILQRLSRTRGRGARPVRGLVLVPTRELAAQAGQAAERYGYLLEHPVKSEVVVGGGSLDTQRLAFRGGADLVLATPGRLLDLAAQGVLSLGALEVLVLDEADRLLSLGFADELARVLEQLPATRQTLMFSATFPPAVQALAEKSLRDPLRINLDGGRIPESHAIVQRAIEVDADRRTSLLRFLIGDAQWSQVLVFVATKRSADDVAEQLRHAGFRASALHGDLSQHQRTTALADLAAGELQVLVATDLAARGIDIAALPAVVNYDLPRSTTDYVHRVGRTGRAGQQGVAVSFVTADSDAHFRLIERRHQLDTEREVLPGFEPTHLAPSALPGEAHRPDPNGGIKGKRKSKKDKLREAAAVAAAAAKKD